MNKTNEMGPRKIMQMMLGALKKDKQEELMDIKKNIAILKNPQVQSKLDMSDNEEKDALAVLCDVLEGLETLISQEVNLMDAKMGELGFEKDDTNGFVQ